MKYEGGYQKYSPSAFVRIMQEPRAVEKQEEPWPDEKRRPKDEEGPWIVIEDQNQGMGDYAAFSIVDGKVYFDLEKAWAVVIEGRCLDFYNRKSNYRYLKKVEIIE